MARFVLTADDYAMTPAVTRGILACLEAGRITATGAMTNRPHWKSFAPQLGAFEGKADLGLHFNLTCGVPLTAMPRLAPGGELPKLPDILRAGSLRRLPLAEVAGELEAQLSAFEDAMGRMPDFIDGHQHVHAMPGVRRALGLLFSQRRAGFDEDDIGRVMETLDALGGAPGILHQHAAAWPKFDQVDRGLAERRPFMRAPKAD